MKRKILLLLMSVVLVAALVPSYVGAASQSEASEYDIAKTGVGAGLAQEQEYAQAINKLERFLSISETGNIVLDAPKGIVNSIDSEVYQSLLAGLEQTNSMIDSGYLVANPDFTLTITEKYPVEGIQALSSSGGITDFQPYWWGCWIYLSDGACDAIVYALTTIGITASGLAAILALGGVTIPGAIASILVGVFSGIGAATINYINRNNTGIEICLFFYVTVVYIGPQTDPRGMVTGLVSNAATGDPLPYSAVTVKQSGQVVQEVETNSDGQYIIDLAPGVYLVTASHTGFYDLTTPVGVSDGASTTLNFQLTLRTGGGGCPFLQVWDGSDYVDEGLLNIHNAEGVDVTYEHTLTTVPETVNGAYEFRLIEHPKTISHIDQVQLRAILEDGTVKELPLRQAWHSEDGNVLNLLLKSDDRRVEEKGADHNGGTSQSIDLEFAALGPNTNVIAFIFTIEGNNMYYK